MNELHTFSQDLLAGIIGNEINIHGRSRHPDAKLLSALTCRPFKIGTHWYSSIEGYFQGIKFPPEDERRWRAFASSYGYAKQFSLQAPKDYIWWGQGRYEYGSQMHLDMIHLGFWASYDQNADLREALMRTHPLVIRHYTEDGDKPGTPFPASAFCALLTEIREMLLDCWREITDARTLHS